ncbi:hypothetical protein [Nocardia sp. XZ_19_231]|uniref:hypothetical protein n=1 Tax=Nocardia sp. XZ_19_231 TaxID=2769252 RepID=UPI00188E6330|nr:hypothetical protein [Nocardia sp. XZ_19_231]
MTRQPDYLYHLLPYVHRVRDAEGGYALRDLLRVAGEQLDILEADIEGLYADWFIETCSDWAVPYIGDLIGYRPVHAGGGEAKILVPRREVAKTIGSRRRKGTLALLEELASDVAAWPARAVEFYRLLGWTQHLDHRYPDRGRYLDVRTPPQDEPFETAAHTVDVRRLTSHRTTGHFNIPSVGVFVWRLRSYPVTWTPACCVEREGTQCYTFSVLGNDSSLFTRPVVETNPVRIAEEINVPARIRLRAFEHRLSEHPLVSVASATYYGKDRSLAIEVRGWPKRGVNGIIDARNVIPADLSQWHRYRAPRGKVLVDTERGRMVFPLGQSPKGVAVSYRYGFSAEIGGGEYRRPLAQPLGAWLYRVRQRDRLAGEFATINAALAQWDHDKRQVDSETGESPRGAVVEIADSGVYAERLELELVAGESLQLRAADRRRPVLRLLDYRVDQPDPFSVCGDTGSRFVLDGMLVAGRGITVIGNAHRDSCAEDDHQPAAADELCDITIRHCTLVPGWDLAADCAPARPEEPSLTVDNSRAAVRIEHSIVGSIWVAGDERRTDPLPLMISDSIVDATSVEGLAVSDPEGRLAYTKVTLARCTVIGEIMVHAIELAENSLFTGPVRVARRQIGCVRYCYVPPGSRTPRRYSCQPPAETQDDLPACPAPSFDSMRYGEPEYLRLRETVADEILRGADDESEVGVFHDLCQPQRLDNLRTRLDEYTPAGMATGIFYAS